MADPLADLLEYLETTGRVPQAWLAAHAPDGTLAQAWASSRDLDALFLLASAEATREAFVSAACACARLAVGLVRGPPAAMVHALEATENWCRGAATADTVRDSLQPLLDLEPPPSSDGFVHDALWGYAAAATRAAAEGVFFELPEEAAASAARAARDARAMQSLSDHLEAGPLLGDAPRWTAALEGATPGVAALIRGHLPCPTLDQLRARFV